MSERIRDDDDDGFRDASWLTIGLTSGVAKSTVAIRVSAVAITDDSSVAPREVLRQQKARQQVRLEVILPKEPLYFATAHNRLQHVRLLLEHDGWDVADQDDDPPFPFSSPEMTRLLLDRGADVNNFALCGSVYRANHRLMPSDIERLRLLLDHGADANTECSSMYGYRVLHYLLLPWAVRAARVPLVLEAMDLLLKHGADINAPSRYGSPLFEAVEISPVSSAVEISRWMIERGADVNAPLRASWNSSLLHFTLRENKSDNIVDLVRLLLDHGADVNLADEDGRTPLDLAKERDNAVEIVGLLRKKERGSRRRR